MTAVRAYQKFVLSALIIFGLAVSSLAANELNDSMQLFHQGDYENAYKGLTTLVQQGQQDARIHYYRGLISLRTGNRAAAARDFQTAMHLESAGAGQGIGESLQRVQGHERLVIEKYRSMARLASRQRRQPVAPPAIERSNAIQLVRAESPINVPTFRLASEVPLRGMADDPFKDDIKNMLADDAPKKPMLVKAPSANDAPVGTGVADSIPADDEDDFFGSLDDDTPTSAASTTTAKPSSVFGAIFRAVTKVTVPQVPTAGVLPPGIVPGTPGQGQGGPGPDGAPDFGGGDAAPFGGDEGFEDFGSDEEDPFGDF